MPNDIQYNIFIGIMYLFMFLFGAVVGSFLNVCIYRLPKEESLIKSNSHCMKCGTPILKRDLIPIVSWCLLRGKCRACGEPISPRYTVVEALNAVGWVVIAFRMDFLAGKILYTILVCLAYSALIVVFFMDWDTQLISTYVCIFIGVLAIPDMIFCRERGGVPIHSHIIGLFAASVPLLIIFLVSKGKAMGLGDVYLMAGAGFFLGTSRILVSLLLGIVLGAIAGVILKRINGKSAFAFGPWLSLGIFISMLYGYDIANWYMNFTGLAEMVYGEGAVMCLPDPPVFPYEY